MHKAHVNKVERLHRSSSKDSGDGGLNALARSCICLIVLISCLHHVSALPAVIRIGAVFNEEQKDSSIELAFKYAVYKINKDRNLLPKTTLIYDIAYIPDSSDSFRSSKKVCRQIENGVTAIFGPPSDTTLSPHIQSICEALDIPHLETRFDVGTEVKEFSINLRPHQKMIDMALLDTIKYLNWTRFAIIYEGAFKQQDLMKTAERGMDVVYIRQTVPDTYRLVMKEIRQKEIYNLIIDTNPQSIDKFFRSILQLQMNDFRYHYMFTTFDIETYDLEDFKYNNVNITAFRLVDVENPAVTEVMDQMRKFQNNGKELVADQMLLSDSALMFDAVSTFAHGLASLDKSHKLKLANVSCEQEIAWNDGLSLFNYIDSVSLNGLTGKIEFVEGKRQNFKLDLMKLKRESLRKVGTWTPEKSLQINDPSAFYESNNTHVTLTVMTREEKPYLMIREGNFTGNDRFEGFCIDLLKGIAQQVGFQYTIKLVPDGIYGVYNPETKSWNGIVRELIERRADLAVASMTINYARENVIDFTKPFMNLGIGILFKVPTSQPTRLFSFMNPLAIEIWLYVLAAYTLVSFTLFVIARFSPFEWSQNFCHQEQIIENQFSVSNSFWFITGVFLRQSSGLNPKSHQRPENQFFSFLNPLAWSIWIIMAISYIIVSFSMYIVSQITPHEWRKASNCEHPDGGGGHGHDEDEDEHDYHHHHDESSKESEEHHKNTMFCSHTNSLNSTDTYHLHDDADDEVATILSQKFISDGRNIFVYEDEFDGGPCECSMNDSQGRLELISYENNFNLRNSFWWAIATLIQQTTSDLYPKATSTRIVGGIWWFFTLIIISSYTANLAAFLTVERMITPIENAADLADQQEISYGTLEGGSTMTFFRDSKIGIYQKMWRFMDGHRKPPSSVFVKSYEGGIARVLEGNYAFLMESTMLDYAVQRDCNLTQIGGLLDSKGYGIATAKGSIWRDKISLAILELQEKGNIQILYDKWWKNTGEICSRDEKNKESKANALGIENIGGVFVVLLCGLAFAIMIAIFEFCWNSKKNAQTERQSLCSEMAEELRFAVKCHGSRQRPALKRNCAKCSPGQHTTFVPSNFSYGTVQYQSVSLPMSELKKYEVDNVAS